MAEILAPELTSEILLNLADTHIRRYCDLLKSNSKNVRESECRELLNIWASIKAKGGTMELASYTSREKEEIRDAYFDEYLYEEDEEMWR